MNRISMAEFTIDRTQNGGEVTVQVGDLLLLKLPESPTTGFRWRLLDVGKGAVLLEREDFQLGAMPAVGAAGTKVFAFRGVQPGTSELRVSLSREWAPGQPDADRFSVKVSVRPA